MNTFELIINIGPQVALMIATIMYMRTRPKVKDFNRKIVKDKRLGKLGERCIWCAHPGAFCSHKPKHFDTPTKSCYEYGCANDCPVSFPPPPPPITLTPKPAVPLVPPPPPTAIPGRNV